MVGGGETLGFWLAGLGYDHLGSVAALFEIATAIALLSLVLVLFVGRAFEIRTRERQRRPARLPSKSRRAACAHH